MSSEAAQKAYPNDMYGFPSSPTERARGIGRIAEQRAAFDAGAVEALMQAAAEIRGKRNNAADANWLEMMADEWERGSA